MTHRPLSATAGAVATALAALLSGCSGGGGTGSTAPALGPVPVITDPAQVTLPTDAPLQPPSAEERTAMSGTDPATGQAVDRLNGRLAPKGGCQQRHWEASLVASADPAGAAGAAG